MIITKKIMLLPTEEQKHKFINSAGVARFIYNKMLFDEQENYKNGGKHIGEQTFRKKITQLKKTEEFRWLNNVGSNVIKMAAKDCEKAFKSFFKKQNNFPKFKSKKTSKLSFYVNYESLKRTQNGFKGEKLGNIKTKEPLPKIKGFYFEPRITFDGKYWYLTIGIEKKEKELVNTNKVIGIDLGIKEFAVTSEKQIFKNINKTRTVVNLKKRLKIKQRQLSKKIVLTKKIHKKLDECKNFSKKKQEIKMIFRRLNNIRNNYLHQVSNEIVKTKPSKIVMENLNISRMLKNKYLSEKISEQKFYEFRKIMEYKCKLNGIVFQLANTYFMSSKTCSKCGSIKNNLKLKERIFICPHCGLEIDRDLNASINLKNYNQ